MFRMHLLVDALDLPGLLDFADDLDDVAVEAEECGQDPNIAMLAYALGLDEQDESDDWRNELSRRAGNATEIYLDE